MRELSLLGISHAVFGLVLLLSKEKKDRSDFLLVVWIFILSIPALSVILISFNSYNEGLLRFINQAFTLLNGPVLYLYIREVTRQKNPSLLKYWPHFILFLIFYIFLVINPAPMQPGGPTEHVVKSPVVLRYFGVINVVVYVVYAVAALIILKRHNRKIRETFAYHNGEISLFWVVFLPVLFLILVLIIVLVELTSLRRIVNLEMLHQLMFLFFILYIVFFGLRQKKIFPSGYDQTVEIKKKVRETDKDKLLLEKVKNIMEREKLYQNPILSVFDLAAAMKISRHQLSSLLNDNLSMNFFQFVNQYRLEEVSRRLKEDRDYQSNILELAFDSGFNSKSSFNSLFKKEYGLTPTQYKKSMQKDI